MELTRSQKNWSQYSLFNKYEQHLSPFGRKVMDVLFKFKDDSKYESCKRSYSVPKPRYENKKLLKFHEHSPPNSHLFYEHTTEEIIRDIDNTNCNINNSPLNSTSLNLIKSSNSNANNFKDIKLLNLNKKNNNCVDFPILLHSADSNTNNRKSNENLVNWGFDEMFDINDIFDCVDNNNVDENTESHLDSEKFKINNVAPENKVDNGHNINFKSNTKKNIQKESVKRKYNKNDQGLKEKKTKTNNMIDEKKTYRKEKYTTTVKNWLNDVHPTNKKSEQNDEEIARNVTNVCQNKVQKNKKIIQAQLANKDGIMKYSKPIDIDTTKTFEKNKKELKDVKIKSSANKKTSMNKVTTEKKVRSKFIAPIKSQIPIKDIEYPIHVINNINELENKLNGIENEEIVIILVFSNGFCQLNSQLTEDTCIPEAILFNVYNTFYYFKTFEACFMNAFCSLISNNTLICYNAKKILLYLYNDLEESLKIPIIFDAKIGGSLISPDEPPESFADLQKLLLITPEYTIATECVLQKTAWYATLLKESANKLRALMVENGVYSLFMNIEMKIVPIIAGMEKRGICVNMTKLKSMESILMTRLKEVEAECHEAAGKPFQINSTLQVRTILYDELQLDTKCNVKIRETISKGAKSTSETMLQSLSSVHPLPRLILEYRHLHKAYSTFVAGIAQHVVDGVVKPTWDQTAAVTGRIASNNPNLQAIPRTPFNLKPFPKEGETESARLKFRSVYTSREGHCLLAADFKHVECRVLARLARDHALEHALRSEDLFTVLAAKWLGKSEVSVSREDRSLTKRLVYASVYGAGARTLGHVLQGTDQQLGDVIDSFHKTFPSLKSFAKSVVSECQSRGGRLTTPSGRTRTFKNIFSTDFALRSQAERRAVNFIIQGTAADLCKRAMCVCVPLVPRARLLLQLHDELLWEVPRHRLGHTAAIIKSAMESCGQEFGLDLVLPVSMYCGDDWGEMEEFTPSDD